MDIMQITDKRPNPTVLTQAVLPVSIGLQDQAQGMLVITTVWKAGTRRFIEENIFS